jgi:hypothetical protein
MHRAWCRIETTGIPAALNNHEAILKQHVTPLLGLVIADQRLDSKNAV